MFRWKAFAAFGLIVSLAAGCSTNGKREPTQREAAHQQWNTARAAVLYSLAKQQFEGGNFEDSRKGLDEAERLCPENVAVHILLARLSIEQGKLDLALKELDAVRQLQPTNAEPDYLAGVVYQRWERPETALQFYVAACQKAPDELSYLLARAEMLVSLDKPTEALDLLQGKLTYFENSPAIRDAVGQLLVRGGKYRQAADVLRQGSILAPDDAGIREHLAVALFCAGEYREASQLLEKLLRDDKRQTRTDLLTAQGECLLALDRPRDARDCFQITAQLQPAVVANWLNLAKAAVELNDLTRAEMSIRKAISLDADSAEAQVMLGYLRLRQNRLDEALAAFRKASQLDPKDTVSLCMCGYVLEKQGHGDEAIACYAGALKLKPSDELAASLMAAARPQD